MPQVTLTIKGREYSLACDEGQEDRLKDVSQYVNSRLSDISQAGAANNESHLQVLTALVLADEIFDLREEIAQLQEQSHYLQGNTQQALSLNEEEDIAIAQAIDHLANKIGYISERIQKA